MLILFLDESGDHSLTKIDSQYPVFVLAGCVIEEQYHDKGATKILNDFKHCLFDTTDIILHTADISRNKNGFERLKESDFRELFYRELNAVMKKLDYTVIACAIRKDEHLERYGLNAIDPYMLSLNCVLERFVFMLNEHGEEGIIVAERRNAVLDTQLELAFLNLKVQGTEYISASSIRRVVKNLIFRDKKENVTGLQIADLVASPIGRFVLGKKIHEDFQIIESKFRRSKEGEYLGFGLIILPK